MERVSTMLRASGCLPASQRDRTVPPLRASPEKRDRRSGKRDPAGRRLANETYQLQEDVQRPDLHFDVRHRNRDLRPVMDGQTMALKAPALLAAGPVKV